MRWINETRGKVVCLLLHSSEYCHQWIYNKLCTLKQGHRYFKRAQITKTERVRENRSDARDDDDPPSRESKWVTILAGSDFHARWARTVEPPLTAASSQWPFFIPADSPYIDSWLSFSTTATATKGNVTRDDSRRRFLVQYNVATLLRHSNSCKVDAPLQRCVALKTIVANRPM